MVKHKDENGQKYDAETVEIKNYHLISLDGAIGSGRRGFAFGAGIALGAGVVVYALGAIQKVMEYWGL